MQAAIQRLNESLIARAYVTWFDLTNMKGSTMDAMSDAIEGADVMLYAVSLRYKESANVRTREGADVSSCPARPLTRVCVHVRGVLW